MFKLKHQQLKLCNTWDKNLHTIPADTHQMMGNKAQKKIRALFFPCVHSQYDEQAGALI